MPPEDTAIRQIVRDELRKASDFLRVDGGTKAIANISLGENELEEFSVEVMSKTERLALFDVKEGRFVLESDTATTGTRGTLYYYSKHTWFAVGTTVSNLDHSALLNLPWSTAGHTIDVNVDFNQTQLQEAVLWNRTTAEKNALSPIEGQVLFDTDLSRAMVADTDTGVIELEDYTVVLTTMTNVAARCDFSLTGSAGDQKYDYKDYSGEPSGSFTTFSHTFEFKTNGINQAGVWGISNALNHLGGWDARVQMNSEALLIAVIGGTPGIETTVIASGASDNPIFGKVVRSNGGADYLFTFYSDAARQNEIGSQAVTNAPTTAFRYHFVAGNKLNSGGSICNGYSANHDLGISTTKFKSVLMHYPPLVASDDKAVFIADSSHADGAEWLKDVLIRADGDVPLTANWDVGNFDLTMKSLTMDGDLTVDTDVFFVDATNDYIGMGSATGNTSNQLHLLMNANKDILIDGTTNPREIDTGVMRFEQTPAIDNTRCITYNVDSNGQNNTHAVVVNFTTNGLSAGEFGSSYDVNVINTAGDAGVVRAFEVSVAGPGASAVHALHADPGVDPVHQESGAFGNVEQAWSFVDIGSTFTDRTTAFNSAATDVELFSADNDVAYWGMAATFVSIEVNLAIAASGGGILPTFEYSDGASGWIVFTPSDETQGFRQEGLISWEVSDLGSWATDTVNAVANKFWIRITRTRNTLATPPTEDTLKVTASTEYEWNKDGDVSIRALSMTGDFLLQSQTDSTTAFQILDNDGGDPVFNVDTVDERVSIGSDENSITVAGTEQGSKLSLHAEGGTDLAELIVHRHSDTVAFGSAFGGARSRGTEASETVVQDDDNLLRIDALGHDGTDYNVAAQIDFFVDGTPGANDMPGRIVFKTTPDGSNSPIEALRINSDQSSLLAGNLDFAQFKAVAMVADGGTTLSADATGGQWFLQNTTGRVVLCQFSDATEDSGTTDGTTADKLVDSTQDFDDTVSVGNVVRNTTSGTEFAFVTAVDSATTLSLSSDIMVSGENYTIVTGWKPIISYGSMTLFVDDSAGEDNPNNGLANGATAFKTIQYAVDTIPGLINGNVIVNIDADTYTEQVAIRGKNFAGNFSIKIIGTMSETVAPTLATSGTRTAITKTGAGWTINAFAKQRVRCTAGTCDTSVGVIESNTADTINIYGTWLTGTSLLESGNISLPSGESIPDATTEFTVEDWATTWQSTGDPTLFVDDGQMAILIKDLILNGDAAPLRFITRCNDQSWLELFGVKSTAGSAHLGDYAAHIEVSACLLDGLRNGLILVKNSTGSLRSCGVLSMTQRGGRANRGSYMEIFATIIDGCTLDGASATVNSKMQIGFGTTTRCQFDNNGGWGIHLDKGSQIENTDNANNTFTGNTSGDFTAEPTSYAFAPGLGITGTRTVKVALDNSGTGILNWFNIEGVDIMVTRLTLDITTATTVGGTTVDAGEGTTGASDDRLIDGQPLTAIDVLDNYDDPGTNGLASLSVASGRYVTATASATPTNLVGSAYIEYTIL